MTPVLSPSLSASLQSRLLKIWMTQRQLLRVMDRQRDTSALHESAFAIEVVTDGYYLVRKNLADLVALQRNLPLEAANNVSAEFPRPDSTPPIESPTTEKTPHGCLAYDIAALNAIAADYADLQDEAETAKAFDLSSLVKQHSRQLKEFLTNLFPDLNAA